MKIFKEIDVMDLIFLLVVVMVIFLFSFMIIKSLYSNEVDEVARTFKYCRQYEYMERGYTLLDKRAYDYVDSCITAEVK